MKLIVGLGNPGKKYENTRHNIGYMVLGELAGKYAAGRPRARFEGELAEAQIGGERVLLLCPTTYMNRSGTSVQPARDFYKIENQDLLIICDDLQLPLARLRFRKKGSAGGQKGLADVIQRLGTDEFPRLRIGIGAAPEDWDVSDYVLSRFTAEERETIAAAVGRAASGAVDWILNGIDFCMNDYNAAPEAR